MTFFLLRSPSVSWPFFAFAGIAGVSASLSDISGFLLWPVGAVCILWRSPIGRHQLHQLGVWLTTGFATLAAYLPGYRTLYDTCVPHAPQCSETYGVAHPVQFAKFFTLLVGNVVPSSLTRAQFIAARQVLGLVICCVAVVVIVQAVRHRKAGVSPLPAVVVTFGLLFDLQITLGRVGFGVLGAVEGTDRYTMPNLLILFGIAMYGLVRFRVRRAESARSQGPVVESIVVMSVLAAFVFATTWFGIANGSEQRSSDRLIAREIVNLGEIPSSERPCYLGGSLYPLLSAWRAMAISDKLTVFQPEQFHAYRDEGMPKEAKCTAGARPSN